ncbi:MAG TPA: hypothetical protein VGM18_12250 [Candidatus Sulfotelmatobacter sp.]|jgi:hypothetical protein
MTNRISYAPHDFQQMCKQAERDHESKKLVLLMAKVKRQLAEREDPGSTAERAKGPVGVPAADADLSRLPNRTAPFER